MSIKKIGLHYLSIDDTLKNVLIESRNKNSANKLLELVQAGNHKLFQTENN
jgi:hypothetical protein